MSSFYIIKASGERERFNLKKFRRSLEHAGASHQIIKKIIEEIKTLRPKSTAEIHEYATRMLQKEQLPVAARYNLKRALIELGPAGFPFEQFIAQLFEHLGYQTRQGAIIIGACVSHEVDVLAEKMNDHVMIECKFHNQQGLKTDVKVALYVKARFDDLLTAWKKNIQDDVHQLHRALIATNTKFTLNAIQYATCTNMDLLGWSYPARNNIPDLIDQLELHPITTLTSIPLRLKRILIHHGLVLCNQAAQYEPLLKKLGLSAITIKRILAEAAGVCTIHKHKNK